MSENELSQFSPEKAAAFAIRLWEAETGAMPMAPPSIEFPRLTREEAYLIQQRTRQQRIEKGEALIGFKVGLTSREAQKQFGVFEPDYGYLLSGMALKSESSFKVSQLIHPRIEGEIAFTLGKDLRGPGLTRAEVVSALDSAMAALEIVDLRYPRWKVTGADLVADNAASSRIVLGTERRSARDLDLRYVGMVLCRDQVVRLTGAGAATMGDPINAVLFLANALGERGDNLPAGSVVMSGALSAMLPFESGCHYTCEIGELGKVSITAC